MELEVFGIGAAGNKAVIKAVEEGAVGKDYVKLFNTTVKDIPEEYKSTDMVIPFTSSVLGGCGKEPKEGRKAIENAYGSMVFFDDALEEVFKKHYGEIVAKENLVVIDQPTLAINKFDNDNFDILNRADLLISDFSGVIFDFGIIL